MSIIKVPAILEGISTLKDGGLSMRYHTNELNDKDSLIAMSFRGKFGWLLFSEQEDLEAPTDLIRRDTGGKTPSQRLRAVLYIKYQQSGRIDITFEHFYAQEIEKFIDHIKSQLKEQ